jgi:hypothetical protein
LLNKNIHFLYLPFVTISMYLADAWPLAPAAHPVGRRIYPWRETSWSQPRLLTTWRLFAIQIVSPWVSAITYTNYFITDFNVTNILGSYWILRFSSEYEHYLLLGGRRILLPIFWSTSVLISI